MTVKSGATLVNNGTITGDLIMESGGIYLGDGTITGAITTSPPVVTITSPSADNTVISDLTADLNLTASIVFNSAFGTPAITWSMVSGPGTVTFENPSSPSTTARFSSVGTYTLRCSAVATVNGQVLQGSAERIVRPGGPLTSDFTATFREGENGYTHAATFIRGDSATWNSGARDQFLIGRNNGGMRGLFAFDLSAIPAAATITSAAFDLWIAQLGIGTVNALELRPLLKDFVEGTGNSSSSATVGANTGADWNSRTGPTTANLWGTAGGQSGTDFSTTVIGSLAGFDAATTAAGTKFGFTLASRLHHRDQRRHFRRPPAALHAQHDERYLRQQPLRPFRLRRPRHHRPAPASSLSTTPLANPAVPTVAPAPRRLPSAMWPAALTGTVSNAENGSQWSLVSGPGDATFGDAALPATTVTFSASGSYLLRLTATNSHGESSHILAVTVAPNPGIFSDWQTIHWPGLSDPLIIGEAADPDGDGESNLLEFATNQNPHAATRALTTIEKTAAGLAFTYTRNRDAFNKGYTFNVEYSDNLASAMDRLRPRHRHHRWPGANRESHHPGRRSRPLRPPENRFSLNPRPLRHSELPWLAPRTSAPGLCRILKISREFLTSRAHFIQRPVGNAAPCPKLPPMTTRPNFSGTC